MAVIDDEGVIWYSKKEAEQLATRATRRSLLTKAIENLRLGLQQLESALELEEPDDAQTLDP